MKVKFEPRDLWIGVYWKVKEYVVLAKPDFQRYLYIYVCLLPCFPMIFNRYIGTRPIPRGKPHMFLDGDEE